jgi:hypothetical protein
LTDGWAGIIKQSILNSTQGDKPFWDWVQALQAMNVLIVGTYAEMDNTAMCTHIKANLNESLKVVANRKETHHELNFKKWTSALKLLDDDHINDESRMVAIIAKQCAARIKTRHENNHPFANLSCLANTVNNTRNPTNNNNTASSATASHLPPLLNAERTLLAANDGCFKCRKPFIYHRTPECTSDYLSITEYKPITKATILTAKPHAPEKLTAAVLPALVMDTAQQLPVAMVMPAMVSCILGSGSDSDEYVIVRFHTPHFKRDCYVGGPGASSEELVTVLIDNGSHSVLIRLNIANRLGLMRHKLPVPEEVEMAMAGGKKETFVFEEWVTLRIISSDQVWSSWICHIIITPRLCVPLLLRGLFLSFNRLVINHKLCTCIDKSSGYDLFNPTIVK